MGSSWRWEPIVGRGKLLSTVRVWQAGDDTFQPETPYELALVELDEGPEFVTRAASEGLVQGSDVKLVWREVGGDSWPCAATLDDPECLHNATEGA
jgi:uncharacterized OB-fold protein